MRHHKPKMTRARFEKLCGGEFRPVPGTGIRTNGTMKTFVDFSRERQEEKAKFCQYYGGIHEAKTWYELAKKIGILNGGNNNV